MLNTYSFNAEAKSYWRILKDVRSEVKLRLIELMSESVRDNLAMTATTRKIESKERTTDFIEKFSGAWRGDESAESIIPKIRENRSCRNPISFD